MTYHPPSSPMDRLIGEPLRDCSGYANTGLRIGDGRFIDQSYNTPRLDCSLSDSGSILNRYSQPTGLTVTSDCRLRDSLGGLADLGTLESRL